jgi:hypothetical protein
MKLDTIGARRAVLVAGVVMLATAGTTGAQGTLSTQGFGYPPGQLSTRALGAGGSIAEIDPFSPINPAALANWRGSVLLIQAEPEYRRIRGGDVSANTTTSRFPLAMGIMPFGSRISASFSASTLLERNWQTVSPTEQIVAGDTIRGRLTNQSEGAINDIRLGGAYVVSNWLRVGAGLHGFTGRHQLRVFNRFDDSTRFGSVGDTATVSYSGYAFSAGTEVRIGDELAVGASMRLGGSLTASRGDSAIARGDAPNRFGIGVAYLGIPNSAIAVRVSRDQWSSFGTLGGPAVQAVDAWDIGVGGDFAGPRLGTNRWLMLRGGARWRTLPFAIGGNEIRERSFSAGMGTLFARNRAGLDLGLARASRTAGIGVDETSWTLSVGFSVRP